MSAFAVDATHLWQKKEITAFVFQWAHGAIVCILAAGLGMWCARKLI